MSYSNTAYLPKDPIYMTQFVGDQYPNTSDYTDCVGIARVSSKEQMLQGHSLSAQKCLAYKYAEKNCYTIVQFFEFHEGAGIHKDRKLLYSVLNFMKEQKIKHLFIEKADRLARNIKDAGYIQELIETEGIQIHFIKDNIVLNKDTHSSTKLHYYIDTAIATSKNDNISEEVKKAHEQKAMKGDYPYHPPIGYKWEKGIGKLKICPQDSKVVAKIFNLYATGKHSHQSIWNKIQKNHVKANGKRYHQSDILKILRNPIYYGDFWFKEELRKGNHTSIISMELFEKCQKILDSKHLSKNGKHKGRIKGKKPKDYLLKDLLKSQDGRVFTGGLRQSIYYAAIIPNTYPRKRICVRESIILDAVNTIIKRLITSTQSIEEMQAKMRRNYREKYHKAQKNQHELKMKLNAVNSRRDEIIDLHLEGHMSRPDYREKYCKNLALKKELEDQLSEAKRIIREDKRSAALNNNIIVSNLQNLSRLIHENGNDKDKIFFLRKIAERVVFSNDRIVSIVLKEPYSQCIDPISLTENVAYSLNLRLVG